MKQLLSIVLLTLSLFGCTQDEIKQNIATESIAMKTCVEKSAAQKLLAYEINLMLGPNPKLITASNIDLHSSMVSAKSILDDCLIQTLLPTPIIQPLGGK